MPEKSHVALVKCFYCLKDDQILLAKRYDHTGEPLTDLGPAHGKVVHMDPCNECADWMKKGIILIGIDNAKSDHGWESEKLPNPWRAGGWSVIKEEAFKRMVTDEGLQKFATKHRFMFMEQEAMEKMGIVEEEETTNGAG